MKTCHVCGQEHEDLDLHWVEEHAASHPYGIKSNTSRYTRTWYECLCNVGCSSKSAILEHLKRHGGILSHFADIALDGVHMQFSAVPYRQTVRRAK